jgi:hypothetical protein
MKLRHAAALALFALTVTGCTNINDTKRAPDVVAGLRRECDSGKASACVDMADVQQACTGHANFGGLTEQDVKNCAAAVRSVDQSRLFRQRLQQHSEESGA